MSAGRRLRRRLAFGLAGAVLGGLAFVLQPRPGGPPTRGDAPASTPAPVPAMASDPVDPHPGAALYRWRDGRGTVHLTSRPPPAGVPVEVIPLGAAAAAPAPAPPAATAAETPSRASAASPADLAGRPLDVYTPQGFQELVERLGEARRRMEERDRVLDRLQRELQP
ncbi:MAG: DUF4124 domain-containing protein [Gammaproteobacteria bacterium]|nr:DUF4124 domain-containing protein [Gammaproteobacteria bacterium]